MTKKQTIRCSALPRVLRCPASLVAPNLHIEDDNPDARLGTAAHELLAGYVRREVGDIEDVAEKHRVEPDRLAPLYFLGRRIWDKHEPHLKVLSVEYPMAAKIPEGYELTGHGDIIAEAIGADVATIVVWDFKSGSSNVDYRDQMLGYGWLARNEWPEAQHIKIVACWIRDEAIDVEDIHEGVLREWRERIDHAIEHQDTYTATAESCRFCPRRYECPARLTLVRRCVAELGGDVKLDIAPAQLAALRPKVQILKQVIETYDQMLRDVLTESGPMMISNGKRVFLREEGRESISASGLIRALDSCELTLDDILPALTVGKGKLMKIITAQAERGEKGAAIDQFMMRLRDANAVVESTQFKVAVKKEASNGTESK